MHLAGCIWLSNITPPESSVQRVALGRLGRVYSPGVFAEGPPYPRYLESALVHTCTVVYSLHGDGVSQVLGANRRSGSVTSTVPQSKCLVSLASSVVHRHSGPVPRVIYSVWGRRYRITRAKQTTWYPSPSQRSQGRCRCRCRRTEDKEHRAAYSMVL